MTATMIDNAGENRAFSRGTRPSGAEWRAHDGHSCPHAFASLSGLKLSLFFLAQIWRECCGKWEGQR